MTKLYNLFLTAALTAATAITASAATAGDWKLHPTFDQYLSKVIDTPSRVYIQAYGQEYNAAYTTLSSPYLTLFVYDKDAEEMLSYNKRNYLSDNIVVYSDYNPERKYLLVSYDSGDIDLVFDSGEVINVPAMKNSTLPYGKSVVSATFDPANNLAYLAMNFGYLIIDDKKGEVKESRVLDKKINAIGRVGDFIVMADDNAIYSVPAAKRYPTFSDFTKIADYTGILQFLPLEGDKFGFIRSSKLYITGITADGKLTDPAIAGLSWYYNITPNSNGYLISSNDRVIQIDRAGNQTTTLFESGDKDAYCGTWDGRDYWFCKGRAGLYSRRLDNGSWTTTRELIAPNAPSAFQCEYFLPTSKYGMIAVNRGINKVFSNSARRYPNLMCGYDNGSWEPYSPAWLRPAINNPGADPSGAAVDPDDERYVYTGSRYYGVMRYNLDNPDDIIQMSSPATKVQDIDFYQAIVNNSWAANAFIKSVSFDRDGNLWAIYPDAMEEDGGYLRCLPADSRRKGNFGDWRGFVPRIYSQTGPDAVSCGLKQSSNNHMVVAFMGQNDADLVILDHNGTIDDKSDDRIAYMRDIYDQDGSKVSKDCIHNFYEDKDGTVWALTDFGIFTFNPAEAFSNPSKVNRIKVTRNDGTNLADYLLDGVNVWQMTADAQGHKWFATAGAGIVCTSADGREVIASYTTDNSYIPDNTVYSIAYNPQTGSLLMSTQKGIAEYFPAGSKSADSMDAVKIYPNPVRPDYFGYVTIEGLVDNALVKIVDASGNLVAELGLAAGGVAQWDVANAQHQRVRTGVYYVLASSSASDTNVATVGQILVVN